VLLLDCFSEGLLLLMVWLSIYCKVVLSVEFYVFGRCSDVNLLVVLDQCGWIVGL